MIHDESDPLRDHDSVSSISVAARYQEDSPPPIEQEPKTVSSTADTSIFTRNPPSITNPRFLLKLASISFGTMVLCIALVPIIKSTSSSTENTHDGNFRSSMIIAHDAISTRKDGDDIITINYTSAPSPTPTQMPTQILPSSSSPTAQVEAESLRQQATSENDDDDSNLFEDDFFGFGDNLIPDDIQSTPMEPYVKGDCDFSDNLQPHVLQQCQCYGKVSIVAEDIIDCYTKLKTQLLPEIYTDDDNGEQAAIADMPIISCDPRNQALLWLASGDTRRGGDLVQRYLAATLYTALNGTEWDYQNLWLSDQNECLWLGMQCNARFQIHTIALDTLDIFGTVPTEVHLFRGLKTLSITRAHITGTIPTYLFTIPSLLDLRLYANQMTGSIPTEVGLATNLEVLQIENNWMYGTFVTELGLLTNLRSFSVGSNQFIRTLPSELGNWGKLTSLVLDDNRVSGTFPTEIGQWTSLEKLLMSENLMTGSLPSEIGFMTAMRDIRLVDIGMHGRIPSEIGLLTNLWRLDLEGQHFAGTIPTETGQLSNLYSLVLSKNDITGTVPTELGLLTNMTRLDLQENQLSGTLPSEIGTMSLVSRLALDQNDLLGSIPTEVCELRELRLELFVVDCPTRIGRGIGNYTDGSGSIEELLEADGNCFTICRNTE